MRNILPDTYSKNIYTIPYQKLKNSNIKLLMFDLDNTIISIEKDDIDEDTIDLFQKLKQDFDVMIVSNSISKKVSDIATKLDIPYNSFSLKPLSLTYKKVHKKYNYKYEEMAMIGDQLYTDILGGKKLNIYTVLVDPISSKELIVTKINRLLEKNKMKKVGFEKGKYYD